MDRRMQKTHRYKEKQAITKQQKSDPSWTNWTRRKSTCGSLWGESQEQGKKENIQQDNIKAKTII